MYKNKKFQPPKSPEGGLLVSENAKLLQSMKCGSSLSPVPLFSAEERRGEVLFVGEQRSYYDEHWWRRTFHLQLSI
jgi:hypothetical protein